MSRTTIILKFLPKVSLNKWYSGSHWSDRKKLKDSYTNIVKAQFKGLFPKGGVYTCQYCFEFEKKPLDASNCVAMVKMIEDIIFEDDKFDIVTDITISSRKGQFDKVTVSVIDLTDTI
jgi:hypothetical protein